MFSTHRVPFIVSPNTAAVTRCPANAGFLLEEAAVFSGTLKKDPVD